MFLKKIRELLRQINIRWRLTILYALVFGGTHVLFSVVTFQHMASSLEKAFDDALFNYGVDVTETISLEPSGDLSITTPSMDRGKLYPFALGTAFIQIRHINGDVLSQVGDFGDWKMPFNKKDIHGLNQGEEAVFRTITKLENLPDREADAYRLVSFPIDNSPVPQLILQIAVPLTVLENQIGQRKLLLEMLVPLALLISILLGYFLSARALQPVQSMIQNAHRIGADQLSQRLPIPAAKDELRELATTINEMLQRIEQAFQSQERFVADASHQLLTPLTIMKAELESAMKTEGDKEVFVSTLQEVDHLTKMIKGLLLLARVEAGTDALMKEKIYFDEVVLEAIARVEKLSKQKSIQVHFNIANKTTNESFHPMVWGEADLLREVVYNLLENATKYSPSNSAVKVKLVWTENTQSLTVEDSGPGIPENQLQIVFERFSRGSHSGPKGFGLGLAIAKKIAEAHNSRIWTENRTSESGSVFYFEIKNI